MSFVNNLAEKIFNKKSLIENYFEEAFKKNPPLLYNSIDIRHNSHKISAIDSNCYPAGFNNLSDLAIIKGHQIFQNSQYQPTNSLNNIFIIPENHSRNLKYFENLANLIQILKNPYNQVFIATYNPEITSITEIITTNNNSIKLYPLHKINKQLAIIDENKNTLFADLAVLNNDLTAGISEILLDCQTPIHPSLKMGWYQRTKSQHFSFYQNICAEIATILNIDPWLISCIHAKCQDIDFKNNIGFECISHHVEEILNKIGEKYRQHQILSQPYCFVKADNGTYGMAVWAVKSPQDIIEINKKERNKMNVIKGATPNHQVIIQEGIATSDSINDFPAEPMIYLINGQVVENLYRCNQNRNNIESLNSAGAVFYNDQNLPTQNNFNKNANNYSIVYELIGKIASLACGLEEKTLPSTKLSK